MNDLHRHILAKCRSAVEDGRVHEMRFFQAGKPWCVIGHALAACGESMASHRKGTLTELYAGPSRHKDKEGAYYSKVFALQGDNESIFHDIDTITAHNDIGKKEAALDALEQLFEEYGE
jgi:hypothetical protein